MAPKSIVRHLPVIRRFLHEVCPAGGLGYKYEHQTRRLVDFVAFMKKRKAKTITTKLAMEWATLPPDRHASWALRLTDVRGFARHITNLDPRTEVPPVGILPGWKRAKPYI